MIMPIDPKRQYYVSDADKTWALQRLQDMVRGDDAALELMAQLVSLLADRRRGKREVQHDA